MNMKIKSVFYKIYFSVIAVFLVLLIIGLFVLNSVLKVYEAAQPTGLMDIIVSDYLSKGDLQGAAERYNIQLSNYEDKNGINSAFKSIVGDKKLSVSSSGKKAEGYTEVYNVKADDESILTVYLKKDEKGGKYGIKGYKIGMTEISDSICKDYVIYVPSDVKLLINGIEVKKEDRIDNELPKILTDKIGSDSVSTLQTVKVENVVSDKFEVKAYASDGKEVAVSEANGVYTVEQGIDAAELEALKTHALNASQGYAKFMQEDASLGSISHYFDTSTEFYNYVRKTELWVWTHTGYGFEDVTFGEAHKYNDQLYSCKVTFTHVLNLGNRVYKDYFDKYIYIEKTENGLKVIDMQTPNSK
ncbi:MAG: hypothetical protein J6C27_00350 [Clostridia bacterium]|nr:hypothetical protein [Clostridia bacterium]